MQGNEVRKDEIAADAHLEDLPAGTELMRGQYTIASYLNSGGFGITYCANDSLGRTVVIKECFPSIMCQRVGTNIVPRKIDFAVELSKLIEQFVSEAHALAALKHKNILHVHQVFEENDTAYMAIDFIDGPDLLDVIENDPHRLTPEEITRLTRRALGAIKYIHDKDILHRDISPDNILIDETGEPVLIDFGAARRNNTVPGRVFSKVKFVKDGYSPQEFYIEGAEQGPWSDLYSFAASMYHAIKGSAPVDGQQRMTAVAQGRPDPYEPLAGQIEGYPEGFLEAMDHALAILPRDRLQSADEWLEYIPTRPTRVRRSMIPSRRTRPAGETGSRNLSAVISPSDSVSETPVSIDDITAEPASDALPENEEFGPIAISREDDNDIATVFDDDDLDDDEPVDIRAESFIEPVPSSKKKQKATKSSPVQDQLAEKLKVAREGAATSMPIVPESDEFEDEAEFDDNVDLFEQDDQSTEELFEEVNAGLASRASTRSNSYPVSEEDTAPDHPDEEFDALETAIAETTEDAKGPVDEADLKLNRRISQIVVQSQQDMKAADEEDDTVIPLEPEDDTPEPVAALEHRKSSGKGIMYGLIAAALALVAAGLGWQFMGGS
ncbi:MAG: serine/threonine-protein kinase, partial [Pseudomonadota bacterium]